MKTFAIIGFIVALVVAGVLLSQHFQHSSDAKLGRQIAGTWIKDAPPNMMTISWTNPVIHTWTISSDGSFSDSMGHINALVTYQGAWLVKDGLLVMSQTHTAREITSPGLWVVLTAGRLSMWTITSLSSRRADTQLH